VTLDPRLPVIVGVGQVLQRIADGEGDEPVDLLADAFRAAEADAGVGTGRLVALADSVQVPQIFSWRYRDPAALVAERLGASPNHTLYTGPGGHLPQILIGRAALDIQTGARDVVLVGGSETWRSRTRLRSAGHHRSWPRQGDDVEPSESIAADAIYNHPAELACGVVLPVHHYPLFENALRQAAGASSADHDRFVARLWSRFSEVAAANPNAWTRRAYTPDELLATGPDNRMVALPYRKRWCSNNQVDMAAAVILCSAGRARELGVDPSRWVFPLAGAAADDSPFVSNRSDLTSSPAIRAAGRRALALAGRDIHDIHDIDDIAHVDLYSCFPSAVEIGARELGLPLDDADWPLTITGGLSFAGGPWNNYVTHAVATLADVLRRDPGSAGLVTGLGGFVTKHAIGVYATDPPPNGFRWEHIEADPSPERAVDDDHEGPATIESWTVMFDRDGAPETGIATLLTPDGRRAWASTTDADSVEAMTTTDIAGSNVTRSRGRLRL
jgi:acetyl-CoA C-acetyltransferase